MDTQKRIERSGRGEIISMRGRIIDKKEELSIKNKGMKKSSTFGGNLQTRS